MHNQKAKSLYDYVDCFRDLVVGKTAKEPKKGEEYKDFVKRVLKLNHEKDWNFICSGMDLIGDTCLAIDHFIRFGLEGATRYDEVGEKYLRLYGVLNSTYIQQEAVYSICKLCQISNQSEFRTKLDSLEIREVRHKLGAHSIDYIDKQKEEILSFVPVRIEMNGFHCNFVNNNDSSWDSVDLLSSLESHLDLMTDILVATIEKTNRSLYKTSKEKMKETEVVLEKLNIERKGGFVFDNGAKFIVSIAEG